MVNYAVNKAVDDETSFSWRNFAQSAVQAYYKGKAGESLNPINPFYDFAASTAIEFAIQGDVLEGDSAKLWWANKVGGWAGSAAIASEAVREFFGDDEAVKQQTGRGDGGDRQNRVAPYPEWMTAEEIAQAERNLNAESVPLLADANE